MDAEVAMRRLVAILAALAPKERRALETFMHAALADGPVDVEAQMAAFRPFDEHGVALACSQVVTLWAEMDGKSVAQA
jgi:hypothetical protein